MSQVIDLPKTFNVNDHVRVRLTKEGVARWYAFYERYGIISEGPKFDELGYTRFQLWCLMSMYGDVIGAGLPMMFDAEMILEQP